MMKCTNCGHDQSKHEISDVLESDGFHEWCEADNWDCNCEKFEENKK